MSAADRKATITAAIAAAVGVIVMAIAGWQAAAAAETPVTAPPASLSVVGEPLIGVFTPTSPASVEAEWTVSAVSPSALTADGVFLLTTSDDRDFASDLHVSYATVEPGGDVQWHDAGTLAAPVSYTVAVGRALIVEPGEDRLVRVRVSYDADGAWARSQAGSREVEASFVVTAPAPVLVNGDQGALPATGGSVYDVAFLAPLLSGILLLAAGSWCWLFRVGRRSEHDGEDAA